MRFKTGFLMGCVAGVWAASKASQLRRGDVQQADWPRVVGSRAESVNAEAAAEKMRAIGDLARERINGLIDSPLGGVARQRATEILTSSLKRSAEGQSAASWARQTSAGASRQSA